MYASLWLTTITVLLAVLSWTVGAVTTFQWDSGKVRQLQVAAYVLCAD